MTSVATRTSPVFRGKYVLSTFLNTPPTPPPPNVPTLEESNKGAAAVPKTVRAQLELHRKNQPCACCHRVIDPAGFALENFDSVGKWRDTGADGAPLDVAGTLADGTKVNGPAALREAILSRPDAFVTVVTEKMLTYALGRGLEPERHAGGSPDREEGRAERLPAVFHCHGNCRERAFPDAHQVGTGRSGRQAGRYGVPLHDQTM